MAPWQIKKDKPPWERQGKGHEGKTAAKKKVNLEADANPASEREEADATGASETKEADAKGASESEEADAKGASESEEADAKGASESNTQRDKGTKNKVKVEADANLASETTEGDKGTITKVKVEADAKPASETSTEADAKQASEREEADATGASETKEADAKGASESEEADAKTASESKNSDTKKESGVQKTPLRLPGGRVYIPNSKTGEIGKPKRPLWVRGGKVFFPDSETEATATKEETKKVKEEIIETEHRKPMGVTAKRRAANWSRMKSSTSQYEQVEAAPLEKVRENLERLWINQAVYGDVTMVRQRRRSPKRSQKKHKKAKEKGGSMNSYGSEGPSRIQEN